MSLLPRSLHRQNTPQTKTENGTATKQQEDGLSDGVQAENAVTKPLSNEDFAKMLLKKWRRKKEYNLLPCLVSEAILCP